VHLERGVLVAELVPRYTTAFNYTAAPLPPKFADVVCGIGLSVKALQSMWPGCSTLACVSDVLDAHSESTADGGGFIAQAERLLNTGTPAEAMRCRLADAVEHWILQSLAVTPASIGRNGVRSRARLLPHIVQRCVPVAFGAGAQWPD
jgi:hypothetical protein